MPALRMMRRVNANQRPRQAQLLCYRPPSPALT